MTTVKNGDYVQVHYKGTLENGEIFDTSKDGQPLEVKIGEGQLIKGFEDALVGMDKQEKKSFTLEPEDAYGHRDETLERAFARSQVPGDLNPKVGAVVALQTTTGQQVPVKIKEVNDEKVVVDLNHPLAGKTLNFDIEIVGITDTPSQGQGCCCTPDAGDNPCGGCGSQGSCC
jgi:peptidylprolyl isomerase